MLGSRRTRVAPTSTHTTTRRSPATSGGLLSRLTGKRTAAAPRTRRTRATATPARRHHRTRATAAPVHHQRRKASIGDKVSGALLKLKGSLTGRPGVKAAGTKRMRGTDGRGSRRSTRARRY